MDTLIGSLVLRNGLLFAGALTLALTVIPAIAAWAAPRATHFKLDNGMDVVVIPDHRAPVVTHMVWYRVGAADEPPGVSGIAHFLEHLMFKGTDTFASGHFSRTIARNGGEDNAFTSHDTTAYFQRVARDRLALVMEMEADRMVNLRLDPKEVSTERLVILEERRSRVDNDPSSILQEQMMAALYQGHPYGIPIIGWEHEMAELSRQDALDFYKRHYGPDNAILVVAGDVTPEEVKELARNTFGRVPPRENPVPRMRPREPKHYAEVRVVLEDPRAGRPTVQRYYLAPSYTTAPPGEAEAIELLMRIVGGGSTSRLYKRLVVDGKKAVSAGGWYGGSGLDSSRLGVYAVAAGNVKLDEVEAEIDAVLDEVRASGVTQEELDRARNKLLAEHVYASDNQSRLARRYGWGMVNGQTVESIEAWPDRLRKVTVEDVQTAAQKHLNRIQSVTGVLLPVETKSSRTGESAPGKRS